jgi:hypothetical protein
VQIVLSWFEVYRAAECGAMRQIEALKRGRPHRYGTPPQDEWGVHVEACGAEMAVAKAYNLYWEPVARSPEKLAGDVADLQVRSTWRDNGRLILHDPKDANDAVFVLVTGRLPTFTVRGWITGANGKQQRYWDEGDGRPAYFVPQSALCQEQPPIGGKVLHFKTA